MKRLLCPLIFSLTASSAFAQALATQTSTDTATSGYNNPGVDSYSSNSPPAPPPSPQDEAELLRLVKPYLYEMTQPVTTYHWSAKESADLPTNPKDPSAAHDLAELSRNYAQNNSDPNFSYMSTAYLPVAGYRADAFAPLGLTAYTGVASTKKLAVTELQIPAGFRVLDLNRDGQLMVPVGKAGLLDRLHCPSDWKEQPLLPHLLEVNSLEGYPTCKAALQNLLFKQLKIDGVVQPIAQPAQSLNCDDPTSESLSYNYSQHTVPSFMIFNPAKIHSDEMRTYDEKTTADFKTRQRLQSMISNAASSPTSANDAPTKENVASVLRQKHLEQYLPYLDNSTGSFGISTSVNGGPSVMVWSMSYCKNPSLDASYGNTPGPPPAAGPADGRSPTQPTPQLVTFKRTNAAELATATPKQKGSSDGSTPRATPGPLTSQVRGPLPPNDQIKAVNNPCITLSLRSDGKPTTLPTTLKQSDLDASHFFWKDLEGQDKTADLKSWERSHLFGCTMKPLYRQVSPEGNSSASDAAGSSNSNGNVDAK